MTKTKPSQLIVITVSLILSASSVLAEISLCDGLWTNRSCSSEAQQSFVEIKAKKRSPQEIALSEKKFLIFRVQTRASKLKRLGGVYIETTTLVNYCFDKAVSIQDCRKFALEKELAIENALVSLPKDKEENEKIVTNTNITQVYTNYGSEYWYGRGKFTKGKHIPGPFKGSIESPFYQHGLGGQDGFYSKFSGSFESPWR